ncbi:MFS transporter [Candidatus Poriferisodalis sp.]|uniref:MFS transporter n=1 Tax=Candidatus Poriferisodalis sp. TaxID=3101277 RepID=UPI003C6FF41A
MKPAGPISRAPTGVPSARPSVFTVVPQVPDAGGRPLPPSVAPPAPPITPASAAQPEGLPVSPRYRWVLLTVIGFAVLGFGSLMTLVSAALGTIAQDLDTSVPTAGWVMTGLMLAMAVSTPAGGKLGDRYGHRRMFMIGMVGMTAMMIANYWVAGIGSFIAVRVVFGLCGGMLMPSGMALLMHAFGPAERARAVGWFQFAMTGAPTIGVVVGGPLLNVFGWRGIFLMFGFIGLLGTALAAIVVKPIPRGVRVPIDVLGALLLAGCTLLALWAITLVPSLTRSGTPLLSDRTFTLMLAGSLACLVLFVLWERRAKAPLLDLRLFRRASFSLPLLSAACNQFAYMGAFIIVPTFLLQDGYGYSVGVAALLMVPRPGAFAVASPLGGTLVTKIGARAPMIFGTTAMIGSMAAFAMGSDPAGWGLTLVMVGLVLSGVSAGFGSPAYQVLVADSVDDKDLGIANGMNQTVMWIGIITGIQSMLAFAGDDPSLERLRATFVFGAIVAAFGFLAPLFATRRAARLA